MILISWFCLKLSRKQNDDTGGIKFIRYTLGINIIFYFVMNWAFFSWPWPWVDWTGRTPSGIIFIFCTISILLLITYYDPKNEKWKYRKFFNF
jgi:hypothetical protein